MRGYHPHRYIAFTYSVRMSSNYTYIGIGAFTAPLAATYFSTADHWTYHFLISLCLSVSNILVLALVFRGRTQDGMRHLCL